MEMITDPKKHQNQLILLPPLTSAKVTPVQSGENFWLVIQSDEGVRCTCPAVITRCRHVRKVMKATRIDELRNRTVELVQDKAELTESVVELLHHIAQGLRTEILSPNEAARDIELLAEIVEGARS